MRDTKTLLDTCNIRCIANDLKRYAIFIAVWRSNALNLASNFLPNCVWLTDSSPLATLRMPTLSLIYQHYLDASQRCPHCGTAMDYYEGEYYQKVLSFHCCQQCEHHLYYGDEPLNCHCAHCLTQRKQSIVKDKIYENRRHQRKQQHGDEIIVDTLPLLQKLFLYAVFSAHIGQHRGYLNQHLYDNQQNAQQNPQQNPQHHNQHEHLENHHVHQEWINFNSLNKTHIAPSFQLFNQLQKIAITQHYFIKKTYGNHDDKDTQYYPFLRLIDYQDPSINTLVMHMNSQFTRQQHAAMHYRDVAEVQKTLLTVLSHEILNYCQSYSQQLHIQFYANQAFMTCIEKLLQHYAVTQILYLVKRGLDYLHDQQLLETQNTAFINTNLLRKTLQQYHEQAVDKHWETGNLMRPAQLPYSMMTRVFLFDFLQLQQRAFVQPLWKCWQDIKPQLQFFAQYQCIECGSTALQQDYRDDAMITLSCSMCKKQNHYFLK